MDNNKNNPTQRAGSGEGPNGSLFSKIYPVFQRLVIPGLLVLGVTLGLWLAFSNKGQAQAGGTVTLLFFDRNGTALTPTQVRSISNNAGVGYNSDFLLDPANMRAISSGPLYTSGTNLAFNIPSRSVEIGRAHV